MIDRSTIDRILSTADIVDVIREFVPLKRSGANYKGLCPFHDDTTPSFMVSPAKQICKCFSCGTGGDVIGFLRKHEQMSYVEAIKWLGRKYGIEVKEREETDEEKQRNSTRESLFIVNEKARDYFVNTLHNNVDGVAIGMAYFRSRGFRDDIIRKFQLGYCLEERDTMSKAAIAKGYKKEYLIETGISIETEDHRLFDRYRGRVIFPVHTVSGRVVAFGGRILGSKRKDVGKYINSPESSIYHKSNELYGLYFAKQAIVKQKCCFLVEGYTDVIQMHQSGIENVVSSSGTSLTEGQIRLLRRFTNNITILYDGDSAGIKASLRGIDMLLKAGLNIKVLLLPEGEDPDSFAKAHTATEFQAFIDEHQEDFITFKSRLLLESVKHDPIKRAEVVKDIIHSISVIPDGLIRQSYAHECSSLLQVQEDIIIKEISSMRRKDFKMNNNASQRDNKDSDDSIKEKVEANASQTIKAPTSKRSKQEKQLAILLIRYGNELFTEDPPLKLAPYIKQDFSADGITFQTDIYNQILAEAVELSEQDSDTLKHFLHHPNEQINTLAASIVSVSLEQSESIWSTYVPEEKRLQSLVSQQLNSLKYYILRDKVKELQNLLKQPEVMNDMTRMMEIMKQIKDIKEIIDQFAKALDLVVTT